jgi:hypothetical protein
MYRTITIELFKELKKWILQAILLTPQLTIGGSRFSNTNISKNSKPKSDGLKGSVRDLGQSDLCKNIEKTGFVAMSL